MPYLQIRLAPTLGWFVIFLVAGALLLENLDGYHNHIGGDYTRSGPTINWAHGWPYAFMVRMSVKASAPTTLPWPHYSRWPVDDAPAVFTSLKSLAIDLAVAVLIVGGTALAVHRWRRRWKDRVAISLRAVFVLTGMVAAATVYLQQLVQRDRVLFARLQRLVQRSPIESAEDLTSWPLRFFPHYTAQALIIVGVVLAIVGVCSWMADFLRARVQRPKRDNG